MDPRERLEEIAADVEHERVPASLFEDSSSPEEIICRWARWKVLQELRLPFTDRTKERISRLELTETHRGKVYHLPFGRAILKSWVGYYDDQQGICHGDIELAAVTAGVEEELGL